MLNWNVCCRTLVSKLRAFTENEEGAITMEWVILTAILITVAMGTYAVFKINPQEAVNDELSYIIMSNMPMDGNPQNREGMGPLDKLLEVIRYKTTVLRGCLGFGISSGSGNMDGPDLRENLCNML